jgi:hypothetical protein
MARNLAPVDMPASVGSCEHVDARCQHWADHGDTVIVSPTAYDSHADPVLAGQSME